MDILTKKMALIEEVRSSWWQLQQVLEMLDEPEMTRIAIQDGWTAKDIIAHIAFWERNMLGWLNEAARGERPSRSDSGLTAADVDKMNAANYEENVQRPLHDVLKEAAEVHKALMDAILALPEDPNDRQYALWEDGKPPWSMIEGNTSEHYAEHIGPIEDYLRRMGKPGPIRP